MTTTTIKFTIYTILMGKESVRIATKDRAGNLLKKPHSYIPAETQANVREIYYYAYKTRPKHLPTGPVIVDIVVYKPWEGFKRPKAKTRDQIPVMDTKVKANTIGGIADSTLEAGPWAITKPDADNYAKLFNDSLTGLYWEDDSQIVKNSITKLFSNKPRIEATITYLDTWERSINGN